MRDAVTDKKLVEILSLIGIISYFILLVVYCVYVALHWGVVQYTTALSPVFLGGFLLTLFWYLPICVVVRHRSKRAGMKKTTLVSNVLVVILAMYAIMSIAAILQELFLL